ncbi:response regulator transcription factor [Sporomusa sp. KB1]|jgi:DNA-binding response OmpR family regulator|uniref:response regulator transcription factor n=1 Tax=Sporomusa sp. KB1 TaxID=943346 RepID=UPI0011A54ACC|nr:response regulator transcription factor [Sporomusa sp. KB1]TWH47715.1 DNA-binding response OmpR family regulator [Sporomusa sp. KB1]
MRILVVEDDNILREATVSILSGEDYIVDQASTGDEGLYLAEQGIHDLIVMDIMLPGISGLKIVKTLRKNGCTISILLLTAKDSVDDRVIGLESGADDYLVKPFAMRELLARIKALIRRKGNLIIEDQINYGNLSLNSKVKDGFVNEEPLGLTNKEYEILEFLTLNKEQIVTRDQIFDRIWGLDSDISMTIVDIYIHYLRKKLIVYGLDTLIQTVRGVGFMLKES